ncbi:FlgO family outer membrane protein [Vannielia litorea]|uniref:FlgO family outer membrane protein n=1 Tax=Vannielia TaxID=2813041 RepID=UPI001C94313F|nr:FlgO family outer membrane protein [Vannielia litorea]MBY6047928.1 tetratricopeptide repeat protein [Vannielia litorea]MBY6075342.1 tetratricopeptide repeat protein [Vannielia litorea]
MTQAQKEPQTDEVRVICIRLFGVFALSWEDGDEIRVRSTKIRAMLAMLATAPEGTRTRAWLQDMLWGRSGHEHGRASLRRALTDLRNLFGEDFVDLFEVNNSEVRLHLERIRITGTLEDGDFLEGTEISEDGFEEWIQTQRKSNRTMLSAVARTRPGRVAQEILNRGLHLQPSIAILPFATARGYQGPVQLGDMISEEISRSLSRSHMLDVISHLSCRTLDARSVALEEIREKLDADYVVAGNYRTQGDHIMLNADFIDIKTGRISWTREMSSSLADFLRGGDDLVGGLAGEIGRAVMDTSLDLAATAPLPDVDSHALLMSAITLMHRLSVQSFAKSQTYLEEVIERVPDSAMLHGWMGKWHCLSVVQGWSSRLDEDTATAREYTARALDIQPDNSFALTMDGLVNNNLLRRHDVAMRRYDEAIEIDPNNAMAWLLKGTLHAFTDDGARAITFTDRARALSPLDPHGYFFDALGAAAKLSGGDYQGALELADRSIRANRRHVSTLRARIVALYHLDRIEEARESAETLLRADPGFNIRGYMRDHPAAEFEIGRVWAQAMREAGIPN